MDKSMMKGLAVGGLAMVVMGSGAMTGYRTLAQPKEAEVLAVGPKTGLADFRHYVEKHRAALVPFVVGYETVDQPTPNQLVAFAM